MKQRGRPRKQPATVRTIKTISKVEPVVVKTETPETQSESSFLKERAPVTGESIEQNSDRVHVKKNKKWKRYNVLSTLKPPEG